MSKVIVAMTARPVFSLAALMARRVSSRANMVSMNHGVGAALFQGGYLLGEDVQHLSLADSAEGLYELACGPH